MREVISAAQLVPLGKRSEYLEQVTRELQALDPIGPGNAHKVAHSGSLSGRRVSAERHGVRLCTGGPVDSVDSRVRVQTYGLKKNCTAFSAVQT